MSSEKTELLKSFGTNMAIILVVSNIIGSGVFKKVTPMSEGLLSPNLVILAWVLAGIITLFGVLSIAEVGTMFPHSGGAYSWLEQMYGKKISFFYGWSCFTVIQSATIASIAFVFAGALNTFVPLPKFNEEISQIAIGPLLPFENIGAKIASILLIVFLTIVNARGAKNAGILSQIFTWIIVICIIGIIIFGLTSSVGAFQNITNVSAQYPPADFSRYQGFGFIMVMVIAMRNAFWGYEGWISLGYIGAEIQNPDKSIPKALITGILIVIGIYVCINFTYLYVMPIDELLTKVNANENNIAAVVVVDKLFGNGGAYIVSAMILISTFGCTNATVLTASRIYYAMAQKQLFFPKAGILHPERKTPVTSLIYQCVWASLLVLSGSFDMLTDLLIFAAFIFYGITVYGVIVLRKKKSQLERPYKVIGYPIVPMIFVIFCVILVVVSFLETPVQSLIGVGLILSGLPFYLKWSRNKTITDSQSSH